jgi:hypothetical protein
MDIIAKKTLVSDGRLSEQGPIITVWKVKPSEEGHMEAPNVSQALRDHNARVTCMR